MQLHRASSTGTIDALVATFRQASGDLAAGTAVQKFAEFHTKMPEYNIHYMRNLTLVERR